MVPVSIMQVAGQPLSKIRMMKADDLGRTVIFGGGMVVAVMAHDVVDSGGVGIGVSTESERIHSLE